MRRQHMGRQMLAAFVCGAVFAVPAVAAEPASGRSLLTGFADPDFSSSDAAKRTLVFDRAVEASAGIVRVAAPWRFIARTRPGAPRDPTDPAYNFASVDRAVKSAAEHGLKVLLQVRRAPDWAEGPNRPDNFNRFPSGTWKPDAAAFGAFAEAIATRYSGSFPDPAGPGSLPRVRHFLVWNEANQDAFLSPQWEDGDPTGPAIYRGLLNSLASGVKSVHPDNLVVGPGTSPFGDPKGGARMRPVLFIRELFCLKGRKKLKPKKSCPTPKVAQLDIFSHNPIGTNGPKFSSAAHPDDASSADLGRVKRVLRKAEKRSRVEPKGRRPIWVTEFWWISNPPADQGFGVSLKQQARWMTQGLHVWWRAGARVAMTLGVSDTGSQGPRAAGLFFEDGRAKPSLAAFRFPFLTQRRSGKLKAWGKAPLDGRLKIQRKNGGRWRPERKMRVKQDQVFEPRLRSRGKQRYRATVGGVTSPVWKQKR